MTGFIGQGVWVWQLVAGLELGQVMALKTAELNIVLKDTAVVGDVS